MASLARRDLVATALMALAAALPACSPTTTSGACTPSDQDGVVGTSDVVLVTVSDTAFSVGGVDSGSTERNIAVQNFSRVTLTLTNVGTRPHDLVVSCIPSGLATGCPSTSCFPKAANVPVVAPGESATTTFVVPAVEGAYPFTSDAPGDTGSDGGDPTALIGEFVVM